MRNIFFILCALIITSCCSNSKKNESVDSKFSKLEYPVVVVAKLDGTDSQYGGIVLSDKNNNVLTLSNKYILGAALYASYKKGDIILCYKSDTLNNKGIDTLTHNN